METTNEAEVWGVNYERFALEKRLKKITKKYSIKTVAEIPAHGAKAMPSIYSLGFGLHGGEVLLVNGEEQYLSEWEKLGLKDRVNFVNVSDLCNTQLPSNSYDFVWNFAYLPMSKNPANLINEMRRISKRYVAFFSVNSGNVGFHVHRTLHKVKDVPWTHGDTKFNSMRKVVEFMEQNSLKVVEKGFVDCPVWPDSLGFRDMRLHKMNKSFKNVNWSSPWVEMVQKQEYPLWMKLVLLWERIPSPLFVKTLYSHIFYVIGEKNEQ